MKSVDLTDNPSPSCTPPFFYIFHMITASLRKAWLSRLELSAEKTVAIFHEVSRNSRSIAPNFVENIGSFGKLKIIGLDQAFLK